MYFGSISVVRSVQETPCQSQKAIPLNEGIWIFLEKPQNLVVVTPSNLDSGYEKKKSDIDINANGSLSLRVYFTLKGEKKPNILHISFTLVCLISLSVSLSFLVYVFVSL